MIYVSHSFHLRKMLTAEKKFYSVRGNKEGFITSLIYFHLEKVSDKEEKRVFLPVPYCI